MMPPKAMPLIELALTCQRCGEATSLEVSFIQKSRVFTCRYCGALSPIDKDQASLQLARSEQEQEHRAAGA